MKDQIETVYYPSLDGIRGLAIFLVVGFHNFGYLTLFKFGWLGVDLFFVLSGYLITSILYKTLGTENYLKNFYIKRVLRIFPLYYSILFITIFITAKIPSLKDNLSYYSDNQWWFWTYLQNWLFAFKMPEATNFLLHFWSLAVEEQFYLIWPLVILLIRKPKVLILLLFILLFIVMAARIVLWSKQIEGLMYFNLYTFTRMDGICLGSILSLTLQIDSDLIQKKTNLIVLSIIGLHIVFVLANYFNNYSFPYFPSIGYLSWSAVFSLLIHEAVKGKSKIISLIFNKPFLRHLGKISFGLYVFHWPIYVSLNPIFMRLLGSQLAMPHIYAQLVTSIIVTTIAFIISIVSYYAIELKFLEMRKHFL